MFPAQITYHRAGSVAEAVQLLSNNEGAKLLAGGHSLLPLMKLRLAAPAVLVDIGRIEALKGISASGGGITIGALTTHAEIAGSDLVQQHAPVLAEAAALVGDPAVRNRGTIGGSVSHADPASDQPTVLTALGATFNVTGPGGDRSIAAADFATGLLENALAENEVLTSISVPSVPSGAGSAYVKFPHPASRYAVVGAAAIVTVSGGTCSSASVVVGGVESTPAPGVVRRGCAGGLGPERCRDGCRGGGGRGRPERRRDGRRVRLRRVPQGDGGGVRAPGARRCGVARGLNGPAVGVSC